MSNPNNANQLPREWVRINESLSFTGLGKTIAREKGGTE